MDDKQFAALLDKPSPYERMVCHGMWAMEGRFHQRELMDGQQRRAHVPTELAPLDKNVDKEETLQIIQFNARPIRGEPGRFVVYASLRPWKPTAWVEVGRIN